MASIVFLRAVNVGATNRCRPALLAKQLKKFDVVNIGAVGTFVVRESVNESSLRAAISKKLPFKCEMMICPAREITKLISMNPFADEAPTDDITCFVNVLEKRPRTLPDLPLILPTADNWLLKILGIENRFVFGIYRRQMKAIAYLGRIEKLLGVRATTRNWNTIKKIGEILSADR